MCCSVTFVDQDQCCKPKKLEMLLPEGRFSWGSPCEVSSASAESPQNYNVSLESEAWAETTLVQGSLDVMSWLHCHI